MKAAKTVSVADTKNCKILFCSCDSTYQDSKYGAGRRVHNFARNACGKQGGWRCTVCAREKAA